MEYPHVKSLCHGGHCTYLQKQFALSPAIWFEKGPQKILRGYRKTFKFEGGKRKNNTFLPIELNHSRILRILEKTTFIWFCFVFNHKDKPVLISILLAWQAINGKVSSEKVLPTQERPRPLGKDEFRGSNWLATLFGQEFQFEQVSRKKLPKNNNNTSNGTCDL